VDREPATAAENKSAGLPESAPWLNDFVDELAAFPRETHDDCVDSVTQALNYLRHEALATVAWWPVRL
jgi:predicted phage terminase large subunit-like protein